MQIEGFEDLAKLEAYQAEIELLAKRSAEDGYRLFLRTSGILPNDDYKDSVIKDSVIAVLIARTMGEPGTNEVEALKNRLKGMDAATQQKWLDGCARFVQVRNAADLAMLTEMRKRLRKGKGAPFPLDYAGGVGYVASELLAAYLKLSPSFNAPPVVMQVAPTKSSVLEPREVLSHYQHLVNGSVEWWEAMCAWYVTYRKAGYRLTQKDFGGLVGYSSTHTKREIRKWKAEHDTK